MKISIEPAPFKEHPIATEKTGVNMYDIVAEENEPEDFLKDNGFNLQQYCTSLLNKLVTLNKSKIKPFLQYQCDLINEPLIWLNKLEKLIDLNRELYTTKDHNIKLEKALMVIEVLRDAKQQKPLTHSTFDFDKVKAQLKNYNSAEDKISYLAERKAYYLQNKPAYINTNETPFDIKVDIEIDLIKTQKKLTRKRENASLKRIDKVVSTTVVKSKSRINTNVNQFVDVFFQMMHEKQVDGKPYLQAATADIAEMIAANFTDKEGNDIPVETIKTVLKPSRFEKRPKGNARLIVID